MPTITKLEPQRSNRERVNVHFDGSYAFSISLLVVMSWNLRVGLSLEPQQIAELEHDDSAERTYAACLNFLAFRPRSARELTDYLRKRGVHPDVAQAVLVRLERAGLVDDRRFAEFWVENRQLHKPRGRRALRSEMRMKGLDSAIVDDALANIGDEGPLAFEAATKKVSSYRGLEKDEFFRKMNSFLQRRGFGYDVASSVTRQLWRDAEPENGD